MSFTHLAFTEKALRHCKLSLAPGEGVEADWVAARAVWLEKMRHGEAFVIDVSPAKFLELARKKNC